MFLYRIRFSKTGKLRFLSHHDLLRMLEYGIRRSGLPIKMTEGFNPHPKISIPVALGIGIESIAEVMEFELTTWMAPKKIGEALDVSMPEGFGIVDVEVCHRQERKAVHYVEYEVSLEEEERREIEDRIQALMDLESAFVTRKSDKQEKQVNVRKYVMALALDQGYLYIRIRITDQGTAKPEEVLGLLGLERRDDMSIRKTFTQMKEREKVKGKNRSRGARHRTTGVQNKMKTYSRSKV